MANLWCRYWKDSPSDPKWRTIAKVSGRSVSEVQAVFNFVLANVTGSEIRGRLSNFQPEDVASALDLEIQEVQAILDAMQGRVLDGDMVTGWEKRQPLREDDSRERLKKWRNAPKRSETQSNAVKRSETQRNAPDTDTDTDTDTEASTKDFCSTDPSVEAATRPEPLHAADLERIYLAYPRHVGKGKAIEAIRRAVIHLASGEDLPKLTRPEALSMLHEKATRFARSPAGDAGDYTPHPATWFGQKRYLDDEKEWERGSDQRNQAQQHQPQRVSPAIQRQRDSDEALQRIAARRYGIDISLRPDQGQVHPAGAAGGNAGDVPGGMGGDGLRAPPGCVPPRTLDGHTGQPVLSPA